VTRRPLVDSVWALEHLTGRRLPGGCDDCNAYQTVRRVDGRFYVLTVHHDDTCPALSGEVRS
jgi:hypothetical protein